MVRAVAKIYLMSSLLSLGHGTDIALPSDPSSDRIGHLHVFADEGQIISLHLPEGPPIPARLFRHAGTTLVPAGQPMAIRPSKNGPTSFRIDFPRSEKPTRYTLIFSSMGRTRLDITALPLDHLDHLRKIARSKPIVLVHPPQGLADCLQRLDVPVVVQSNPQPDKEGVFVVFANVRSVSGPIVARRIVMVVPSIVPGREIWVSKAPEHWSVTVPPGHFSPQVLSTADGQARLIELLLGSPDCTPSNNRS